MIFRRFLTVAQALVKETDEASWRSAVSRAYYAAFHVGRDHLAKIGFDVPRADRGHAFVWLRLSNTANVEVDKVGRFLNQLRSERNKADYAETPRMTQTFARDMVDLAEMVIATMDRAFRGSASQSITEAIKKSNATC